MTNPSDPWSRRPEPGQDSGPTEQAGPGGHPSDNSPTEYFGQPIGADATRVMPPADAQWGGYETGGGYEPTAAYSGQQGYPPTASYGAPGNYGAPGYPGGPGGGYPGGPGGGYPGDPGMPTGGYQPAGFPQNPPPPPPKRNTTLWVALAIGAVIVVAIAGVLIGTLLGSKDSSNSASASSSVRTSSYPLPGNTSAVPLPSGIPTIPGLGDLDQLGANMGTIASNDGSTLTLTSLSGDKITVKTDDKTQVISLGSTKVADLAVGEVVMVQGDKNADGSIQAKLIFSTSLPSATR
ncbi:DUF5666 domain-containing protein [Nocardia sp. CDC160]|uniref:DUF5666 domain-containing protein n=1 Tax=Nocardia sp. CDC160 TaxID=3112166 RepID=UPI002DB8759D|nr:DUF5666 domain-containing protein [Nocardia sp. CDC160]MEC3920498.1 DUF5666 domain-containing protein [Nocardia sp. CDC160]